ncbi:transposase family protein [Dapis sp. BLCC M172]|uniref:transposase family protein n=1 Tax=Dapis sp. BLCC M172 TaxID=2975281 RepID=UPI003CFA0A5C
MNLLIKQQNKFDKKQKIQVDKGDQGEQRTTTPKKKPRKQELAPKFKEENKEKAKKRIFVEDVIRLIKIFGVARERFRLKDSNSQKVILTVCGLVRLRIGTLILV